MVGIKLYAWSVVEGTVPGSLYIKGYCRGHARSTLVRLVYNGKECPGVRFRYPNIIKEYDEYSLMGWRSKYDPAPGKAEGFGSPVAYIKARIAAFLAAREYGGGS